MTCYKPLCGCRDKLTGEVKVLSRNLYNPDQPERFGEELFPIPCGNCIGCRLDYSRFWADRLLAELTQHAKACFITLTYADPYLPKKRKCLDYINGECDDDGNLIEIESPFSPLVKKDVQDFMKRLRKRFPNDRIRYYATGEYGEKGRPHYHIILFGCDFSDDRVYHFTKDGFIHYVSPTLYDYKPADESNSLWKYGLCDIAEVSWQSCAYVARYTMKKLKGNARSVYDDLNYEPEFALMSRKPGIGKEYFEKYKDQYRTGLFIGTESGSIQLMPNRYFDSLYDIEYSDELADWKNIRKELSKNNLRQKLEATDKNYNDLCAVVEKHKIKQCSRLRRTME